jgi:hypothetical protein
VEDRKLWRSQGVLVFMLLVWVALALTGFRAGTSSGIVGTLCGAGIFASMWRRGLITSADGVRLREPFHTVFVPWDEITEFSSGPGLFAPNCIIELTDGTTLRSSLWLSRGAAEGRSQQTLKALNELLDAHRAAAA